MGFVEGVEEEGERVAALEDLEGTRLVLVLDENGRRERYLLGLLCRGPGPLRLVPLPEFRPPLGAPAATCVVAAGEDGTVRKLDRECPVFVGRGERALVEDVEGAALVGPRRPDGNAVLREPGARSMPAAFFFGWRVPSRGRSPARCCRYSRGTMRISSGTASSLARRCGRSGVLSPFRERVP
uniref:hypothetical protein n=1 Tax=Methanoculleus bourgensis TaxID=83986 RepID=UPI00307C72B2